MDATTLVVASVSTLGLAFAIVLGIAVLEWALPDADLLGHDLDDMPKCRRCDEVAWRCGLCENHYDQAMADHASSVDWEF